ncbi:DMT family transporter [Kytococcus sedentarius]|uniref:DMT family transporter n=1 Tax=Kytococcus sedentarius TaxID=1276 RepID=UPI0035BC0067
MTTQATAPASATPPRSSGRALPIAVLSLMGATLFWAGNYVVGAAAVETIDPISLVWLRWVIAVVPLLALAHWLERPDWRALLRAWPWIVGLSLLGMLAYTWLLYVALEHTPPFNASLINAFNPALIALMAVLVLGDRLTGRKVLGVAVALVGVLIVISDGDLPAVLQTGVGTGELFMVGAVCVWTAYTIAGRIAPKLPPVSSTALQAVVAVVLMAPVTLAAGGPTMPPTSGALWALLFIAVFPSVLAYLLWNRALEVIPASSAGVFMNLVTVYVAAFTLFTGGVVSLPEVLGGALVIAGVVLTNAQRRARPGAATTRPA